ncbi:hypothetical protein [Thermoanaerobacterium thermosaccharolyticum]|uniref:Uncharacterized protein n=1 Tax=Thermoanaerobacterium thermosaccharolyticum M0795 TaxID=698948 RepID=L0II23_THETR|nr:hypothetical protein [Thermoanaerobacterium thermosaccharolyticum]AGB17876.1 hypothetical protein Thethe_00137 [Thermoanaerobacterium thermosaccharolyticum M0795]MDK2829996.1 hypothetical protein [Clostridium butyricum]
MLKKVVSLVLVVVLFSVSTFSYVFASEISSNEKAINISSNTIITENNILEVCKYLGIDAKNFKKMKVTGKNVYTVGELEKVISQAKTQVSIINLPEVTLSKNNTSSSITDSSISKTNILSVNTAFPTYSKMLYYTYNGDGYSLTYSILGYYSYYGISWTPYWTGVGASSVSVDTDSLLIVYKVTPINMQGTYNSDYITLKAEVRLDMYVGVSNIGLVKINSNTITSTTNWDTSYI